MGAGKHRAMSRAGWTALALGVGFAFVPASAFWFLGGAIVDLFLDTMRPENRLTIELAISFLAIAALFQFADAILATAMGALRGLKDTRVPMLVALAGYWGLGVMSATVLVVHLKFGGEAIWICLAIAVSVVGVLLVRRFWAQSLRLSEVARHSS